MSVVLKIKRSLTTATPASLLQGELAYSELSQNLFFGSSQGVIKIGGLSDVTKLASATAANTPNTLVFRDATGSVAVQDIRIHGNLIVDGDTEVIGQTTYTGETVFEGDIFVNGGDIKSTATTFNLFPTNVTTLNVGGATTTTTFAGNVSIGGSLTVAQNATVGMDFAANTATITGDLMVDGNTTLGNNAAVDSTTIKGVTTVQTSRTKAAAEAATTKIDAFKVVDSTGASLFQIKDNGDAIIGGVLTVSGTGTSTFAGDVAIGGSLMIAENATVTMNFEANSATISGNLSVNGNTNLGNDLNDTTTITGSLSVSENATFSKEISANTIVTTGNVTIGGDLTVNGTTTTVNSTTTTLSDPVISLAQDTSAADAFDRGVDFKWHNGTTVKTGFFGFDDSTEKFTFIPDATVTSGEYSGTAGTIVATRFEGLADRAERLETARTISLSGDVTGSVSFDGTQNVTIAATIAPNSVALGTDTTGQYAKTVSVSGLGLSATTSEPEDGTDYVVSSNATVAATNNTLVYRGANAEVNAGHFVAETAESRFKAGINGLAADGTTKTNLVNFVIDGGTF